MASAGARDSRAAPTGWHGGVFGTWREFLQAGVGPGAKEAKLYADLVSSQNLHKQKLWRRPTQDLLGVDKVCPHSLRNS